MRPVWSRIAVLVVVVFLVVFVVMEIAAWRCAATAEMMGVEHHWGIPMGCMVKIKHEYLPLRNVREFR